MTVMKSKDIHIALKRDDSISYLMERFEFADKESLFEAIRKVTPSGAEDFIKRLEKKQKIVERRERNNACAEEDASEEVMTKEQPVQEPEEDGNVENVEETIEEAEIEREEHMQKHLDIEQLKVQERELSEMVCSLEVRHKEFVTKRRESRESLVKAQKAFRELLRLLNEQERNVTKLYNEYKACAREMEKINEEKKACEALLEDVRAQISDLNKVTILVYKNGKIEVENAEIPSISEEEISAEFNQLICMPEAEDVKIKELKTIAKLLQMVKVYKANNCPYELEFDSTEVQRFWETVTA